MTLLCVSAYLQDPDTNMSYIFPARQPDGTMLFVSQSLTAAETATLSVDLARVFSNSSSSNNRTEAPAAGDEAVGSEADHQTTSCRAKPEPSIITVVNIADGREFDLQLPAELAATGVATDDIKLAMADKLAHPAALMRLAVINYGSTDLWKVLSGTDMVDAGTLVRLLLPTAQLPRAPATPYAVAVKTLTGEHTTVPCGI